MDEGKENKRNERREYARRRRKGRIRERIRGTRKEKKKEKGVNRIEEGRSWNKVGVIQWSEESHYLSSQCQRLEDTNPEFRNMAILP